jgi:hypothetical protein
MIRRDDEMEVEMEIDFALWQPQHIEEDMTQENMVVFALEMWWSRGVIE